MIDPHVADTPSEKTPGGWRGLYAWLTGTTPPPASAPDSPGASTRDGLPAHIGRYHITRKLGEGGMGVVYAARDDRLQRTIALKVMSSLDRDETARKRFWLEARTAASVNHPNVCQIHEIAEDNGTLFIAMELLEGESLADRLRRGPLNVPDALSIAFGMLAALAALHARGFIHRDLKPSNVFLTSHGVKLLDFGLARPERLQAFATAVGLTQPGVAIGTPRYMAPEQATGEPLDVRCDLFAVGAILFEMLAGRPAFAGRTIVDTLHATLHEHPPALTGSPAVAGVDRVIRRALAKRPADRPASADEMAEELRHVHGAGSDATPALAQTLTRLVVLPFRVLRPDPETDFLAFSLPDAISTSLSQVGSLVVRSSATATRFAGEAPDLRVLASEADVDRVVMGTLLRSGEQLRATTQLVEAPGGTLLASHTIQSSLGDLFRLQDDIARRVVEALSLPLTAGLSPAPEAPHNSRAYEFYLRANEAARTYAGLERARDLYLRALELDPRFAPAWAHLGRCHRVIGKYIEGSADSEAHAEEAFRRALSLNPRLSIAHKFYAALQADLGQGQQALVRLLEEAGRHGNDPELFAGLVHTCRYCGLHDESIAAHAEARRLDPNIATSYEGTLLLIGETDRLLALPQVADPGADEGIKVMALGLAGRREEARDALIRMRQSPRIPAFEAWSDALMAWLEGRPRDMLERLNAAGSLKIQEDPEANFVQAWMLCDAGEYEAGLGFLQSAVRRRYYPAHPLANSRHFDALRGDPRFQATLAAAEAGRQEALAAFRRAGGERLLGR